MPVINRNDLKYDYTWSSSPSSNPRTGVTETESQSSVFKSNHGDDVLSLINEYADKHQIESKKEAIKLEKRIKEEMEQKEMTRSEVMDWLQSNS